jgi:predicted Rossmann fold nucleotide-binding protein DprA/Smf involved in DNA uptake
MAYGIDSAAHRGTLEMPGSTVAVLGTAINSTYPSSNYQLRNKIIKFKGAVISEYPVNAKPEIYYFPARNRIVSGLSHALVVVSAAEKSGALITADFAHSEGKPVYVFTGPETRQLCKGCNRLVANKKAVGVESVEQLVKELETFFYSQNIGFGVDNCETIRINMNNSSVENKKMNKNLALNKNSAIKDVCCKVLENLEPGINVETLASKAGCTLSQAGAAITELELNGYIKRGANGNIIPLTQEGNRNGKNSDNC